MISTLIQRPEFAHTIAQRGWSAWGQHSDMTLASYHQGLDAMMSNTTLPLALVAHDGETYHGSVLLITNDLEARPNLSPWLAALWVDEKYRNSGIATQLMQRCSDEARRLRFSKIYLCAKPDLRPFYLAKNWQLLEENVEGLDVFSIPTSHPLPSSPSRKRGSS
jgi:GNAT superfamily N-acetyltransferase